MAWNIALAYVLVGGLWISCSGWAVHHIVLDNELEALVEQAKGWLFILVTAGLLGVTLNRYFLRLRESARQLQASEERWKFALEGGGQGVWDWNALTNEVFFSARWKAMLGFAPEEIGGTLAEWKSRVHPDDLPSVLVEIQRHLDGEIPEYTSEHRIRCKDGSFKWVLDQGKVMARTADGKPLRILGTHTDITGRKQAEQALAAEATRRRVLVEQSRDGIVVLDAQGRVFEANQKFAEMLGYSQAEVRQLFVWDWDCQWSREQLLQIIQSLGEVGDHFETTHRRKDGSLLEVEVSVNGVMLGDQKLVFCVCRDISRRKQAEAALRESESRFRSLFENMEEGVALHELVRDAAGQPLDYRVLDVNPAFERHTGLAAAKIRGRVATDCYGLAAAPYLAEYTQVAETGRAYRFETYFAPLQKHFAVSVCSPKSGQFATLFSDITESRRTRLELEQNHERYRRAIAAADLIPYLRRYRADSYEFMGEGIAALTGYQPVELKSGVWQAIIQETILYGELAGLPLGAAAQQILSGNVRIWRADLRIRARDGRIRWLADSAVSLFDADGGYEGSLGILQDITERKQADEILRASRLRLHQAMSAAKMGAWEYDFATDQLEWSDELFELFGLPKQKVSREFLRSLIHVEDKELPDRAMQQAIVSRSPYRAQYRITSGGRIYWVDDRGEVQLAADGRPVRITGVAFDITEAKLREQELKVAHDRNTVLVQLGRELAEAASPRAAGLAILEAARQLLGWDCAWLREVDESKTEWRDLAVFDVIEGERREVHTDPSSMLNPSAVIQRAMTEGQLLLRQREVEGEQALNIFGNGRRSLSLIFVPLRHAGQLIGLLSIQSYQPHAYDEASVKLLQALADHCAGAVERTRTVAALRQSETQFRAIFEVAAIGVALVDPQTGRWLRVNRMLCDITGYTAAELLQRNVSELTYAEDRERDWELYQALVRGEVPSYQTEKRLVRKNGEIAWVSVSRTVIRDTDGRPLRTVATIEDITARWQMEEALRESEDRFRRVVEQTPEAVFVRTKELFAYLNPAALALFGAARAEQLLGQPVVERFAPAFRDTIRARMQNLDEHGDATIAADHVFLRLDGKPVNVSVFAFPFGFQGRPSALVFARDITALKQSAMRVEQEAHRTELLLQLHQRAPQLTDKELYDYVLEKAVQLTDSTIGFFHQVSEDQKNIILTTWNKEALKNCTAAFETHYPLREAGNWVDCVREQRPVIYNDFAHSPNQRGLPAGHAVLKRFMSIPVINDGKVRIIFGVGNKAEDYTEADKSQLQLVANELHKLMQQRDAQSRLRQLSLAVEQSPASIVITDPHGVIEYVNPRFTQTTGYTLAEVRGQNPRVLKSGDASPEFYQELWQTILRGEVWRGEFNNRRKDGTAYWEFASISPIKDGTGQITHFVAVKEDITERKRLTALQRALLTLGEKLNLTSDPLSAARALFATVDEIWKWDSATLHLLSEDPTRVQPVLMIDVIEGKRQELPSNQQVQLSPRMVRVINQGAELILRDLATPVAGDSDPFGDVQRLSAAIMCVPVRREDTVVGILSLQSYTAHAYAPEDLRLFQALANYCAGALMRMRSEAALQTSQERYRGLVETTLDWVWEVDAQGRYTYSSPRAQDILGYPSAEVLGRTPYDFMPPEEAARVAVILGDIAARRVPFSGLENTNLRKDGRVVVLETSGVPVLDGKGNLLGYRGMDRDVTERRRLEQQLRQAQKLEAIGQLAGGVAHDFNNIIAATMMHLSLLQANPAIDEETQQALKELDADSRRAAALTRQLLAFSRRSVLAVKPLDLNEVVGNLLKMLARLIGEHIQLNFESASNLPLVEADSGMLEQVLMNLVVNARDAMPKGGRIVIRTGVTQWNELQAKLDPNRRPGRFAFLSVSDTGTGMDAETLQRIFEPFFTTKEAGKGTGLGLATVHGIVAQHKGWVEVTSAVGQGAMFQVFLPVLEQSPSASGGVPEFEAVTGGSETVLVVEDEIKVRRLVAHILRSLGYRVHEAADGRAALKLWEVHGGAVDLLFTDMVMPEGMTGLELALELQALKPGLKVMISSGYSAEIAQTGLSAARGFVYLAKPYEARVLAKAVRSCLDQKR